jgi:hypothetical protein
MSQTGEYQPLPPIADAGDNTMAAAYRNSLTIETSNLNSPVQRDPTLPISSERIVVVFPFVSIFLIVSTILVFCFSDTSSCSQPLAGWDILYVGGHVVKSLLHDLRLRYLSNGNPIPPRLLLTLGLLDLASPAIWSLGGYYIFRTESCSTALYVFTCILWTFQTLGMLLPCFLLSTFIFCVPFLVRLAPYFIRPNPNTIAASREVISKLSRVRYSDVGNRPSDIDNSCSICLGEYTDDDMIMKLPCGHFFHSNCVESWLNISQLCPVDRSNVSDLLAQQTESAV